MLQDIAICSTVNICAYCHIFSFIEIYYLKFRHDLKLFLAILTFLLLLAFSAYFYERLALLSSQKFPFSRLYLTETNLAKDMNSTNTTSAVVARLWTALQGVWHSPYRRGSNGEFVGAQGFLSLDYSKLAQRGLEWREDSIACRGVGEKNLSSHWETKRVRVAGTPSITGSAREERRWFVKLLLVKLHSRGNWDQRALSLVTPNSVLWGSLSQFWTVKNSNRPLFWTEL